MAYIEQKCGYHYDISTIRFLAINEGIIEIKFNQKPRARYQTIFLTLKSIKHTDIVMIQNAIDESIIKIKKPSLVDVIEFYKIRFPELSLKDYYLIEWINRFKRDMYTCFMDYKSQKIWKEIQEKRIQKCKKVCEIFMDIISIHMCFEHNGLKQIGVDN